MKIEPLNMELSEDLQRQADLAEWGKKYFPTALMIPSSFFDNSQDKEGKCYGTSPGGR